MSISGILSSGFLQKQLGAPSTPYQQSIEQLSKDLQSGNLSAAQSEFSSLQKAFAQPATGTAATSTASISKLVAQAFNQLATDLKSGNLSAAQKDFSILQQYLENLGGPGSTNPFQHHQHLSNSLLQNLNQVGQNLTTGNLFAAAQQAYATLQAQPAVSTAWRAAPAGVSCIRSAYIGRRPRQSGANRFPHLGACLISLWRGQSRPRRFLIGSRAESVRPRP